MSWTRAANHREAAVEELRKVRVIYADSDLVATVKQARLVAIDRKIDALEGLLIPTPNHWPWSDDGVEAW